MFILLKPTDLCNISCRYCSAGDFREASKRVIMPTDKAVLAVQRIYDYAIEQEWQEVVLCFHGGEPLIAGVPFYEDVLAFARRQEPRGCKVTFSIQSNLTLLNESFLSLFGEYGVQVSTSLDGPPEIHDRLRPYTNGRGTCRQVVDALNAVRSHGIQTGIICTVSRENVGFEQEIYAFFKELDHDFKANLVHSIGAAATNNLGLTSAEAAQSRIRFFDLWFFDSKPTIREGNTFEIAVNLLTNCPCDCMFQENCQDSILAIEFDGNATACDAIKYANHEDATVFYGNVFSQSLGTIMTSDNRQLFLSRRRSTLQECTGCEYLSICNGGCMLDSLAEHRDFRRKTPLCTGYRQVFEHIKEVLSKHNVKTFTNRCKQ